MGVLDEGRVLTAEQLRYGMDRFNQVLRKMAHESGVECIDLESLSGNEYLFFDDCHYISRGIERVAELIVSHLLIRPESLKPNSRLPR